MTDYKELDMTIHENCIHYPICLVNDYIHNRCGYYFEKPKQGKWIYEGVCSICRERCDYHLSGTIWIDSPANYCPNCGADMRKEGDEK